MSKQKLNILVPIKRVIDHQLAPRLSSTSKTQITIPSYSINPFDDIAIEECIKLKEQNKDLIDKIKIVTISNDAASTNKLKDILYKSLAKGCTDAKIIEVGNVPKDHLLQPLAIAHILQKEVEAGGNNLVILGKQAIDEDNNNVGQMLAGLLNWPQATNACKIDYHADVSELQVTREVDSGEEIVKAQTPMVITTDLRLNVPRYATLPKIMKAKKLKIEISKIDIDEKLLAINNSVKILEYNEPEKRKSGIKVASVDELIENLKKVKAL